MAIRRGELLAILHRIQETGPREHRLSAIARETLLTPSHVQRVFARAFGESPDQLSRRLRMERAAALLIESDRSVAEVAEAAGFASHEGFTRAFRAHFGRSPRAFRAQRAAPPGDEPRALRWTVAVGPCVRLYRRQVDFWDRPPSSPSSTNRREEESMAYEVTREERPATPALVMTRRTPLPELSEALGAILPAVFEHATSRGIAIVGAPFARYTGWSASGVDLTAGLPVADPGTGEGEITPLVIPAGAYARTIHPGSYDALNLAHEAVEQWLASQGLAAGEATYEFYLTDPGQYPDEADWRTEVLREIRE